MEPSPLMMISVCSKIILLSCSIPTLSSSVQVEAYEESSTEAEKGFDVAVRRESSISGVGNFNISLKKQRSYQFSEAKAIVSEILLIENVIFWGCYYLWSGEDSLQDDPRCFMEENNPQACLSFCKDEGSDTALLRGLQCICKTYEPGFLQRLIDGYCSLNCSGGTSQDSCGGNVAVSVYCVDEGAGHCREGANNDVRQILPDYSLYDLHLYYDDSQNEKLLEPIRRSRQCLQCSTPPNAEEVGCFGTTYFGEAADYFPLNDPIACVLHCRRKLASEQQSYTVAYTFWRIHPDLPRSKLAYCQCMADLPTNETFVNIEVNDCNAECPSGGFDEPGGCGNNEDLSILSAFCTSTEEPCLPLGLPVPEEELDDPLLPETTTAASEVPDTSTETTGTTDNAQNSSTQRTTTTATTTKTTTAAAPTTTTTTATTTTTTITTTTTERQNTEPNCPMKCTAVVNGRSWEECPGKWATMLCRNGANGVERWYCLSNATFENSKPDSSNCTTEWYSAVRKDFEDLLETKNQSLSNSEAEHFLHQMEKHAIPDGSNKYPYYGHEIKSISYLALQIVNASKVNLYELNKLLNRSINISGILLVNKEPWEDLTNGSARAEVGIDFFASLEQSIFTLSKLVNQEYNVQYKASGLSMEQFVVNFARGNSSSGKELIFPASSSTSYIRMEEGWENLVTHPEYVGYLVDIDLYGHIFPSHLNSLSQGERKKSTKILNSKLLSLSLNGLRNGNLQGRKVRITFEHHVEGWGEEVQDFPRKLHPKETRKVAMGTAVCVYWSLQKTMWSTDGCNLIHSTPTSTICECSHLTSFAVLMDMHNYVGKDLALEILTFLLCPVSVACLLVCSVVLTAVNAIQSQRTTITKHLCVCLMIGMILFLFVVDRNYFLLPLGVCTAVGIITHYVYLAAFIWMAIEGVHLYKMVVHVFESVHSRTTIYRIIAYGFPVIVVGTTCVAGFMLDQIPYGGEMYCWLQGPYIWCFIIPVAIVVMGNMIVLFVALKTAIQMKTTTANLQAQQTSYRACIRGSFSITVLLGITWLPGFVLTSESTIVVKVASYIFVLLNASQGIFLFIFNCLLNEKVRRAAGRNLGLLSWLSMSPSLSKATQNGRRSENNRFNSSTSAKGHQGTSPQSTSPARINPTADLVPRNWNRESRIYAISSDVNVDAFSDRTLKATTSYSLSDRSDCSDNSQKALHTGQRK